MHVVFASFVLVAGGLLAVQAAANLQVGKATGNPVAAATLQLGVGTLLLLALAAPTGALGAIDPPPRAVWWHWLGGIGSAVYVTAAILLFPRLGAVTSVGLFIAGQMLASLALDGLGLLGVRPAALGGGDALGATLVLGGGALIVRGQAAAAAAPANGRPGWVMLGLMAGAALPIQGAVNALLRVDLGAPLAVGVVSFAVATLTMTLVLLAIVALGRAPGLRLGLGSLGYVPWWGWLGGVCGAAYVTAVFMAIPAIGAAVVVGLTVAGQQVASVFFDRYGLMRLPRRPVTPHRLAGVALLLVGVGLIQVT